MPIPPPSKVRLSLTAATPSVIDDSSLKTQLENVGLNCSELSTPYLQQRIGEVTSQLQAGAVQSFRITAPAGTVKANTLPPSLAAAAAVAEASTSQVTAPVGSLAAAMPASQEVAVGNWTEDDAAQGYANNLEVIQFPTHFDWLMSQKDSNGFTGVVDSPPAYTGNYPNAQAIQTLFINVAYTASSTVVNGVDKATMEAVFSNVIQPLTDATLDKYDSGPQSRSIMLAENYNTTTGYADAIGVVTVDWRLQISDYKRKTKNGGDTHPTTLTISARSVLYSDVTLLCQHYNAVLHQFGIDPAQAPTCGSGRSEGASTVSISPPPARSVNVFDSDPGSIPPPPARSVNIFDSDPGSPTQAVFNQGIPSTNDENASLAIVLFSPNLQIIASLDNTKSAATTTYSTSVSRGFTFSTSQSLSIATQVGVNIEIVTASITVTFALSFSESWTTTETKTISFECPPGKKAFVYQGTLMSKLMKFSAETAQYTWVSAPTRALTEVVVTTELPIGSAPSNQVAVKSS